MLRLLILCEYPTLNGGEQSLLATIDQFARNSRRQLEIAIAAPEQGPLADAIANRETRHCPWTLIGEEGKRLPRSEVESRLADAIRTSRPALVHANSLSMARVLGRIAPQLPMPCTGHIRDIMRLNRTAISDLNQLDGLVAVSHATRNFHVDQGIDPHRCITIYNGVDTELYRPDSWDQYRSSDTVFLAERQREKSHASVSRSPAVVATIGQIGLRKGQDLIPAVLHELVAQGREISWWIIGQRHSQKSEAREFEQHIHDELNRLDLRKYCRWMGVRTDLPALYRQIDIVAHFARQEPFGRVLLEAAAAGCGIVATEVGGTPEMLTSGRHAFLVPPDDPSSFAEAIGDILDIAKDGTEMRLRARQHIVDQFSIRRAADSLADFWQAIILDHQSGQRGFKQPVNYESAEPP